MKMEGKFFRSKFMKFNLSSSNSEISAENLFNNFFENKNRKHLQFEGLPCKVKTDRHKS